MLFLWIAAPSFAVLDFLLAQLCRSFGFASTRFELRSPGFTRTEIRRNDALCHAGGFWQVRRVNEVNPARPAKEFDTSEFFAKQK